MIYLGKDTSSEGPLRPKALPNRYHMEHPFELLQITVRSEQGEPKLSIFQAAPGSVHYVRFSFSEYTGQELERSQFLHSHDYYELLFVLEGEITQNIENDRHFYAAGSCCMVSPDTLHSEEYTPDTEARLLFLKLSKPYVQSLQRLPFYFEEEDTKVKERLLAFFAEDSSFLDFIPRPEVDGTALLYPLVEEAGKMILDPPNASSLLVTACIWRILLLLLDSSLFGNTPVVPGTKAEQLLFGEIKAYMEQNAGKVTRADLEKQFHYSGDYLYKVVRSRTGLSIHDFGLRIRMQKAAALLSSTSLKVQEVASACGFANATQFYKAFEEVYHMTPARYRKTAKNPIPSGPPS